MKRAIIFLTFVVLALFLIHPVNNNDIWMHIKTGQLMLENVEIATVDDYSYTVAGKDWLNHQWLSQIIFYLFYNSFGTTGIIFLQFILLFFCLYPFIQESIQKR